MGNTSAILLGKSFGWFDFGVDGADFSFAVHCGFIDVRSQFRSMGRNYKVFDRLKLYLGSMCDDVKCIAHGALSKHRQRQLTNALLVVGYRYIAMLHSSLWLDHLPIGFTRYQSYSWSSSLKKGTALSCIWRFFFKGAAKKVNFVIKINLMDQVLGCNENN